jgi:hypothetical protein
MTAMDVSSQSSGEVNTDTSDRDIPSEATTSSFEDSMTEFVPSFASKPGPRIDIELAELFSESAAAKIWRVAANLLKQEVSYILTAHNS